MAWTERLINVLRRSSLDAEVDAELQFHIEQRTRDNTEAGMPTDEARHDAELRFGGRLRAHEQTRDADVLVGSRPSVRTCGTPCAICDTAQWSRESSSRRWRLRLVRARPCSAS